MSGLKFTQAAEEALGRAIELAKSNANSVVTPVHLACSLLQEQPQKNASGLSSNLFQNLTNKAGGDAQALSRALNRLLVRLPTQDPPPEEADLSPNTAKLLRNAQTIMKDRSDQFISVDAIILALATDPQIAGAFKEANLTEAKLKAAVNELRAGKHVDTKQAEAGFEALSKYAIDLTELAESGKLDPVIGRDNEIRRVIRILSRRTKNNPVLIGEPGVGKTAIAEGLANRIVRRDVPANLLCRLYSLDVGAMAAGASYKGEFEQRWKDVLSEIEKSEGEVMLFIDELHLIMAGQGSQGGGMDAANLLKPLLARGKLRVMGATTLSEYRQYIEKDAAFERRFQQVIVNEPSVVDTISILRGVKDRYEVHHGVSINDAALVAAATLASRYLTSRRLPDSAIDLCDEAAAAVRVSRDSQPEIIDQLERKKLQLEVEMRALQKEKDDASKERVLQVQKAVRDLEDELQPLKASYEASKNASENLQHIRQRIDDLKAKAERAERNYDLATAADLRHYAIPDAQAKLEQMEAQKRKDDSMKGDLGQSDVVTVAAIEDIVAKWTGIPVTRLKTSEKEKLLKMEKVLSSEIVGQAEAVKKIANAIRLSRSGLADANKPPSFLLCGPSGTGKTQLTKALARFLFDSEDTMIRIDASEYSEKHSISRLIGAPAGYVGYEAGGQLTEFVRRKPFCVILVDELEKAAKEFTTIFLQVMDAGRLTDGQGRIVNFSNSIIVFTSNLGSQYINAAPSEHLDKQTRNLVDNAIRSHLLPEFLGRVDATVIFNRLGQSQVREIVDIRLREIQKRIETNGRKIVLDVEPEAKDWLGNAGVSPVYGARPLASVIQQNVLVPLSRYIIEERIKDGETAKVRFDGPTNRVIVIPNHESEFSGMDLDDDNFDMPDARDIEIEEVE